MSLIPPTTGTNTYLISDERSVLVDAAEGEADYLPHLRSALSGRPPVSDIILTHWHHDHVLGLSDVLKLLDEVQKDAEKPKVWKHPSARPEHDSDVADQLKVAAGKFKAGSSSAGEHPLEEGQVFKLGGHSLQVVRTPGHTDDSISLILKNDASSSAPVIFTADTVLGQGTTVFEELGPYLASLKKLVDLAPQEPKTALYPGHGPVIEDGRAKMEQYIAHRLEREQQVIDALRNSKEASTTPEGYVPISFQHIEKPTLTGRTADPVAVS